MFFNNKDSQNEIHHLNQDTTLEISESSPLDAIFSNTRSKPSSSHNSFNLARFFTVKQQTKSAIALSLLSTLVMSSSAQADTLKDYEPFNNYKPYGQSGTLSTSNSFINMIGSVGKADRQDYYSIRNMGGNDGKINWSLHYGNKYSFLSVYEDVNKNKLHDAPDRFLFNLYPNKHKSIDTSIGTYYLARMWGSSNSSGNYYAAAGVQKTVKLNVISAKNYGKFDGRNNKPDFYVKTQVWKVFKRHQSKTIANNNNPVFNHHHQETYFPRNNDGLIPLSIDLYDSDRFSKDDQADIHPNPKLKRLDLVYDLVRNQIRTDDGRVLGKPGRAITVKGDRPGNSQASVTFIVR